MTGDPVRLISNEAASYERIGTHMRITELVTRTRTRFLGLHACHLPSLSACPKPTAVPVR